MKKAERELEKATKDMSKVDRDKAHQAFEDVGTNLNKGMIEVSDYANSDLNLTGWKLTRVLDDILMCRFSDINEAGTEIMRGGIWVPLGAGIQAWRVAEVLLAGPRCSIKPGQHVIFPGTFGLKASNINNLKHIVFLNEARIFGVAEPEGSPTK